MRKTADGNSTDLKQFIEDLRTVLQDGQELLRSGLVGLKEKATVAGETTGRLTRERPYQAIGVAFGLGLILGFCRLQHILLERARDGVMEPV